MSIAFLNGDYLPLDQARISPMDRGFLFGDAVYEVIPSFDGRLVGFGLHMQRMQRGLNDLQIEGTPGEEAWRAICEELLRKNGAGSLGLYLHISRGADNSRRHVYPGEIKPTLFAFSYDINAPGTEPENTQTMRVQSQNDLRWRRCHMKTTALLGNVMHMQESAAQGNDEVLLYNEEKQITEGASCNVFVIKDGVVATPPLEQQILPGITRHLVLDILRQHSAITTEVRPVSLSEAREADEIWFTSSTRDLIPVVELDGAAVGSGHPGPVWQKAQQLFAEHKYSY